MWTDVIWWDVMLCDVMTFQVMSFLMLCDLFWCYVVIINNNIIVDSVCVLVSSWSHTTIWKTFGQPHESIMSILIVFLTRRTARKPHMFLWNRRNNRQFKIICQAWKYKARCKKSSRIPSLKHTSMTGHHSLKSFQKLFSALFAWRCSNNFQLLPTSTAGANQRRTSVHSVTAFRRTNMFSRVVAPKFRCIDSKPGTTVYFELLQIG